MRHSGADASLSLYGGGGGLLRYRDPAIAEGSGIASACASDVYSFNILAWQVLSGLEPFSGYDVATIVMAAAAGERPPIAALPGDLPPRISALITTCWDAAPTTRPTAAEVAAKLRE